MRTTPARPVFDRACGQSDPAPVKWAPSHGPGPNAGVTAARRGREDRGPADHPARCPVVPLRGHARPPRGCPRGGALDKLAVYAGLGVGEVWFWREGRIQVHVLRGGAYARVERSALLPALDVELLARFLTYDDQTRAAREYLTQLGGA